LQGELEHRSPKSRYRRTDRKSFVKQLTRIERRQARIRRIGDKIVHRPHIEIAELARSPCVHHHIGATQKFPVHIGTYLISHEGDPAIKVNVIGMCKCLLTPPQNFVVKLKSHLLKRIHVLPGAGEEDGIDAVILKDDWMYRHNIARFNYTTYDVRRGQDVINPKTSHCNVMVLRNANDVGNQGHRFLYGKVLGIYHVNVIYVGSGMVNYTPLPMEFLWVRWYEPTMQVSSWENSTLDRIRFPPMTDEYSFDFLDPSDVLRGCHIIPSFEKGKRHPEGSGMSGCAGDNDDRREYFVNR
jgi:hypothetical protein